MIPTLSRQIGWAQAQVRQQRRMMARYAGQPRARDHAARQLALAEAAAATLAGRAAAPAPIPNRLNLWMAEPTAAERQLENAL